MGLEYKVIRHVVIEHCPRLSGYVQEAYNLSHSAAQIETCFQVLRKVHFEAARYQRLDATPPWDTIKKKKIGATRPAHSHHVDGYAAFVKAHVDTDGELLRRISTYLKSVPVKASVKGSLYSALAEIKCHETPEYIEMVVKAMYNPGKAAFRKAGVSTLLHTTEIASIGKQLAPFVKQAVTMLREATKALGDPEIGEKVRGKLIGDFSRDLVAHVHSKSKDHKDLSSVGWAFWTTAENTLGELFQHAALPRSWGKRPKLIGDTTESVAKAGSHLMKTLNENGDVNMLAELARLSFGVGCVVQDAEGNVGTITKATNAKVTVDYGGEVAVLIQVQSFIKTHRHGKLKVIGTVDALQDVTQSTLWVQDLQSAKARLILDVVWKQHFVNQKEQVTVQTKPSKKAFAKCDLKKNELVLIPISPLLRFYTEHEKAPSNATPFKDIHYINKKGENVYCHILAKHDDGLAVPYFYVGQTPDLAEVNVVPTSVQVSLLDQVFNVPVLTNGKAVAKGEELRLYSKPLPTAKAAAQAARIVAPVPVPKPKPAVAPRMSVGTKRKAASAAGSKAKAKVAK
jgi:hypothetical protein